jgi:NAD(P)-dependent dehydrogenase (short-subunit alcohol dehydrogenase family)
MPEAQVVLITGATVGLGRATAQLLSAQGFRVFGTGRHPEAPTAGAAEMLPLDVTQADSVHACVAALLARAGRLDVLVNNAGVGLVGAVEETSDEEIRSLLEINFLGVHRMIRAVLPIMREQRSGLIINLASAAGFVGVPQGSIYSASKFALEGYTQALRLELRPFGLQAALIEPGYVSTEFAARRARAAQQIEAYHDARDFTNRHPGQTATPDDVARTILRVIRTPHPGLHHPVGQDARLAYWASRKLPSAWFEWGQRRFYGLR